jgi:hypothetical protein
MTNVWIEERDARVERGRSSLLQIKGGEDDWSIQLRATFTTKCNFNDHV